MGAMRSRCSVVDQRGYAVGVNDRARAIQEIRSGLLFFGYDASSLTDEQIVEAVNSLQRTIQTAGISVDECTRAITALRDLGITPQQYSLRNSFGRY